MVTVDETEEQMSSSASGNALDAYDSEEEVDADMLFLKQQKRNVVMAKTEIGQLPDAQTDAEAMLD